LLTAQCRTPEEIISAAEGKDIKVLIVQYAPITEKVFENLPSLKAVVRYGIGYDVFDIEAATKHGVCAMNVENYCEEEVATHAMSLILALNRKIIQLNEQVKEGKWDVFLVGDVRKISQSTLGLIGFGKIAQKVAKRIAAFGADVLVYDPYIDDKLVSQFKNTSKTNLKFVLEKSDFISIHTPLTEETEHMIGADQFRSMKDSACVINTSRGPIIDEKALIESLKNGEIAGAALDVLEEEPISKDSSLKEFDNVILTPHASWYSNEAIKKLKSKVANQAIDVLQGNKPEFLINEEVWGKN